MTQPERRTPRGTRVTASSAPTAPARNPRFSAPAPPPPLRGTGTSSRPGTHRAPAAGPPPRGERFGYFTEWIARSMGTPWFLVGLTVFVLFWLGWNTFGPVNLRFDSISFGFIALTLVLSLQASYAAPLILLAQNRQDDRDRVQIEQDRQRAERNLADTEYLAREVAALRLALKDAPSKDFIRDELRALLEELSQPQPATDPSETRP